VISVKRRVIGYFLSAASVYLTISYMAQLFLQIISNISFTVI
jgi:hypothetical protein